MKTNRDVRIFIAAIAISSLGDWLNILALMSSFVETHGASAVATLFACRTIPGILVGLFLSGWISRLPVKASLAKIPVLQAVIVLWLAYDRGNSFHATLVASAMLSCLSFVMSPLVRGAIPLFVEKEELGAVNSRIGMVQSCGYVAVPALSGLVVSLLGVRGAFIVDVISFMIFASLILGLNIRNSGASAQLANSASKGSRFGAWKTVFSTDAILAVGIGLLFANASLGAIHATEISFFKNVLGISGDKYGLFVSIAGLGALLGAWLAGKASARSNGETFLFSLGVVTLGGTTILFSLSTSLPLASALLFVSGFSEGFYSVLYATIVQKTLGDKSTAAFALIGGLGTTGLFLGRFFSVITVEPLQPSGTLFYAGIVSAAFCLVFPALKVIASMVRKTRLETA
jgi:predicted MFS family arabinose efflux permease